MLALLVVDGEGVAAATEVEGDRLDALAVVGEFEELARDVLGLRHIGGPAQRLEKQERQLVAECGVGLFVGFE